MPARSSSQEVALGSTVRERRLQKAQNGALAGRPVHPDAVAIATHQGVAVQGSQGPVTPYRISQHLVQRPGQDRRLLICQNGHRKRIGRKERHVPEELHGGCIVLLELVRGRSARARPAARGRGPHPR